MLTQSEIETKLLDALSDGEPSVLTAKDWELLKKRVRMKVLAERKEGRDR